jgi:hypothetical protein
MFRKSEPSKKHPPTFGVVSILCPWLGFGFLDHLARSPESDLWGIYVINAAIAVVPATIVCGGMAGIYAFVRGERYQVLPVLGLLENAVVFIWAIDILIMTW